METCCQDKPNVISLFESQTIPGLFRRRVARNPDTIAYREFDDAAAEWRDLTSTDMLRRVESYKSALAALRLSKGNRVALLLRNGSDWVAFDIAAMACGLVTVPLYLHDGPNNSAVILAHSGCSLLLVDCAERWTTLAQFIGSSSQLETVWLKEPPARGAAAPMNEAGGRPFGPSRERSYRQLFR